MNAWRSLPGAIFIFLIILLLVFLHFKVAKGQETTVLKKKKKFINRLFLIFLILLPITIWGDDFYFWLRRVTLSPNSVEIVLDKDIYKEDEIIDNLKIRNKSNWSVWCREVGCDTVNIKVEKKVSDWWRLVKPAKLTERWGRWDIMTGHDIQEERIKPRESKDSGHFYQVERDYGYFRNSGIYRFKVYCSPLDPIIFGFTTDEFRESLRPFYSKEFRIELEEKTDEVAGWKTYEDKKCGFKLDYPAVGWRFEKSLSLWLGEYVSKEFTLWQEDEENQKDKFFIYGDIFVLTPECFDYSCKKIVENNSQCFYQQGPSVDYEGEIITDAGIKGCQKTIRLLKGSPEERTFVIFPLRQVFKAHPQRRAVLILSYYSNHPPYSQEEIEIFNQVVSTFRFVEE